MAAREERLEGRRRVASHLVAQMLQIGNLLHERVLFLLEASSALLSQIHHIEVQRRGLLREGGHGEGGFLLRSARGWLLVLVLLLADI